MSNKTEFVTIFIVSFFSTIIVFPVMYIIFSKVTRRWLKTGIEGENERLDMHEIKEVVQLGMCIFSFLIFAMMIIAKTLVGREYSIEEYTFAFLGTLGSNAVSAFTTYMDSRKK